jgi:sugar lactone lactonase YvrE
MKSLTAELLFNAQNTLGEGPLWHPLESCLYWVDIEAGFLYQSDQALNAFTRSHFDTSIGAFCFTAQDGFILATGQGFLAWDGEELQPIWNPLPQRDGVRLNDGKVDPAGRFWAGSIDTDQCKANLYRLDPDNHQYTLLDNLGIANGLDWSPDRKTMYFTDSFQYTIFAFDYDLETGAIHNQRSFIQLPKTNAEVVPDGLCVDVEGCVWSAQWNGWQVVRYSPIGEPILSVKVPAQRVTSCCFGGEHGDLLFITTARTGLSEDALENQPHAGDVFVVQTNTTGQTTHLFGSSVN